MNKHLTTMRRREIMDELGRQCFACHQTEGTFGIVLKSGEPSERILGNAKLYKEHKKDFVILCRSCNYGHSKGGIERSFHGSYSYYQNQGCRCDLCRIANTNYIAGRASVGSRYARGKKQ